MNIVVFIKQVPDNTKLKPEQLGEAGIPREGVEMMVNPFDEYALETALRLKEAGGEGSKVSIISLGSGSAKDVVKKAIAAGGDEAFLLTDPVFLEGDNTATALALANAAKTLVPDHHMLLFGQTSLDDGTSQTGPKVAELLEYPSLTACKNAEITGESTLKIMRETERGVEFHEMTLPGVICMMKCDYELRTANIKGVMKANKTQIPVKTPADLGLSSEQVGANASTTTLTRLWQRPEKSAGIKVEEADPTVAVEQLLGFLKTQKVL